MLTVVNGTPESGRHRMGPVKGHIEVVPNNSVSTSNWYHFDTKT